LFGAYHFGTGANSVSQAKHFLDAVQPDRKTVVVLDFEAIRTSCCHCHFGAMKKW
jgi:GH25 family lysozyme M1 (1,4-beta-N-acetylmuramidase)